MLSFEKVIAIAISIFSCCVLANDFGVHGHIFAIDEMDLELVFKERLNALHESGEYANHQEKIKAKIKSSAQRPKGVRLPKASKEMRYTVSMDVVVSKDIKDNVGRLICAKGTKVNPLETVSLSKHLVFIDGDDVEQCSWVETLDANKHKFILVNGAPVQLMEKTGKMFFFDQAGWLVKKLKIKATPSIVSQKNNQLIVKTILLQGPRDENT